MAVTEVASRRLLSLGACCLSWFYTNFSHLFLWHLLFRSHNPILLFCFFQLFFSFLFFCYSLAYIQGHTLHTQSFTHFCTLYIFAMLAQGPLTTSLGHGLAFCHSQFQLLLLQIYSVFYHCYVGCFASYFYYNLYFQFTPFTIYFQFYIYLFIYLFLMYIIITHVVAALLL